MVELMYIKDFVGKYNLHDSYFEEVNYVQSENRLTMLIDFAFWMQNDYVEGEPESGILQVTFHCVKLYACPDGDPCGDFVGILESKVSEQGGCIISMADDMKNSYFEMQIYANDVSVTAML